MLILPEELLKILLAVLIGGLIGLEREYREKAAGLRTLIFICMGATVFTIFSATLGGDGHDPGRIAAQIVTGIGFLGAGVIIRENGRVVGITTAATIWLVAALGMGLGIGKYELVALAAVLALIVLAAFPKFEKWLTKRHIERTYEVAFASDPDTRRQMDSFVRQCGLVVHNFYQSRSQETAVCSWATSGTREAHQKLVDGLFANPSVKEFRY